MEITLKKAIKIGDKEVKTVNLDFEKLTGNDMIQAEAEARALGSSEASVLASMKYQAVIAAKAIGCKPDDVFEMNAADFKNILVLTASFLLG